MGSSSSKPKAYLYYFDIHFGLGLPLDEVLEIKASGKRAWNGSITNNGSISINKPNLFGGPKTEGGLQGTLHMMFGDESQSVVARLKSMLGGVAPAFRGFTSGFYSGLIAANNPYPKPWEILRRGGNRLWGNQSAWYPEKQFIWLDDGKIKAMNPVHILYQIRTSSLFRNWPRAWLDDASWRAAADTCFDEGLGLCIEWRSSDTFKSFSNTILDHISAEVFDDRRTGLIKIRMLRDDYNPNDLPLFTEDNGLLELLDDEVATINDLPSSIVVKYTDANDGEEKSVRATNPAVAARGWTSSETVTYTGAPTAEIAARLCQRDLRIKSAGLRRYKVVLDRRASGLNLGDVIRVQSTRRGIDNVVLRVGKIEDGTLTNGKITVTALQDVFGVPASSFVNVPPPGWVAPDRTPQPVVTRKLFEAGHRDLVMNIDPANLELIDDTTAYIATTAIAPTSMSLNYTLTTRIGTSGDFIDRIVGDWTPTAVLVADIERLDTNITIDNITLPDDIALGTAAWIDNEIVRIVAIDVDAGTCTIARGCLDTVPAEHNAGAVIWFYDDWTANDQTQYSMGLTVQAKLLTQTSSEQLDPALAGTDAISLIARQSRPYPPGRFFINNSYPDTINYDDNVVISYRHRDRIAQSDQIIDTTVGNIGPEPGTTYTAELRRENNSLIISKTGVTGTTITVTDDELDDDYGLITIRLFSVRDGINSWQAHEWTLERLEPPVYPAQFPSTIASNPLGA